MHLITRFKATIRTSATFNYHGTEAVTSNHVLLCTETIAQFVTIVCLKEGYSSSFFLNSHPGFQPDTAKEEADAPHHALSSVSIN